MTKAAASHPSQRDERVFNAAFGMMDSNQDGEAVAAFMRVRDILQRHGSGFRRLLERSHEAEHLNEELGRQNARLLRENAALRARDSRPVPPTAAAPARTNGMLSVSGMTSFRNWDIGVIVIVAVWGGFGLVDATTALSMVAIILIGAAFTNWFSPVRFFAGLLLAIAGYGTLTPQPATPPPPASAAAKPPAQIYAGTAAPATPPMPADSLLADTFQRQPDSSLLPTPITVEPPPSLSAITDAASTDAASARRPRAELRTRHTPAARADCGPNRLQSGNSCPRSEQWYSFIDSGRSLGMHSE
jgi:hypothetical protein